MDFLARREYGQAELIRKLADKGFDRDVRSRRSAQLTADGLQSDQRFAESFVQSRINQGKGPVRIRLDLGQRGIRDSRHRDAIERSCPDWHALARESAVKKIRSRPSRPTSRKKPARCGSSSTAVSSKTIFNRRLARKVRHWVRKIGRGFALLSGFSIERNSCLYFRVRKTAEQGKDTAKARQMVHFPG